MKLTNNILIRYAAIMTLILCTSCMKERLEVTYNKQEDQISRYIDSQISQNETYTTVHNNGSNRLTKVHGEGEELGGSGTLTFYYAGYIFTGSVSAGNMFSTNHETSATDAGWELTETIYEPLTLNLNDDRLLPGLKNGLVGVKGGEECEILFSGKHGFGNKTFGIIPANSALLYKIWVISVSND